MSLISGTSTNNYHFNYIQVSVHEIIVYYNHNRKLREREASKFHIQLCLSLTFMLIVFVVGIGRVSVKAGCITVGVLIHYYALVAWMWMGAEALLMFQKLVIVFTNITWKYLLSVSIICWSKKL